MATELINNCLTAAQITSSSYNGSVIENSDGSVSVFMPDSSNGGVLTPTILGKMCCEYLKPTYTFDINTQKCMWTAVNSNCAVNSPIKIVLNPNGNDGNIFYINDDENCSLNIQFDYLFKINCQTLLNMSTTTNLLDVFETFDASVVLEMITSANTTQTVVEYPLFPAVGLGGFYNYLTTKTNSGFYVCGDPSAIETSFNGCTPLNLTTNTSNVFTCNSIKSNLLNSLFIESGLSGTTGAASAFTSSISASAFASDWLTYNNLITDKTILSLIANNKIKISVKINNSLSDFCVLIDEISLEKTCVNVERTDIFVTKSPGFDLERIRDNKKSWINNTTPVNRTFSINNNLGVNPIRQTDYDVNDERLVINSKEIDLDINIASAIETDVWCYVVDNPCILTGITCPTVYSCPAGYYLTDDSQTCVGVSTTATTSGATTYTANTLPTNSVYGTFGSRFFDNIDNLTFPLNYNGFILKDNNGAGVSATTLQTLNTATVWGNPTSSPSNGRLNNCGIWTTANPLNQWIGFSYCLNIPQSGVYCVGIGADNDVRFKVNGVTIVNLTTAPANNNFNFKLWHVFPLTFTAGLNIIEMEGLNTGGAGSFGAEIYSATPQTLTAMTTDAELSAVTIFTTLNEYGNAFYLGTTGGFSCPAGYALNTCDSPTDRNLWTCVKIDKINSTPIPNDCIGSKVFNDNQSFEFMDSDVYDFMDTVIDSNRLIDFTRLITQSLSSATTVEDFEYILTSELIDAKTRQTLSGYPTLRALYDRYMQSLSYCTTDSSKFDYMTIDKFASLIDSYWVDVVEQVIPATTIWGSVKVYTNTIFDQQKFKYKAYTSLFNGNPYSGKTISDPINGTSGKCQSANVITTYLNIPQNDDIILTNPVTTTYNTICLAQYNTGSEFIGNVTVMGPLNNNAENSSYITET